LVLGAAFLAKDIAVRGEYTAHELQLAAVLMAVITLLRGVRGPEAAVLQAAGEFRQLAYITLVSAPLTIATIVSALHLFPSVAVLTLIGVALGDATIVVLMRRAYTALTNHAARGQVCNA
jgi:hypothetical protein